MYGSVGIGQYKGNVIAILVMEHLLNAKGHASFGFHSNKL
jgi:hypothetical protein